MWKSINERSSTCCSSISPMLKNGEGMAIKSDQLKLHALMCHVPCGPRKLISYWTSASGCHVSLLCWQLQWQDKININPTVSPHIIHSSSVNLFFVIAPDDDIRGPMEEYFNMGVSDVQMVDLLKAHYDTNAHGLGYLTLFFLKKSWILIFKCFSKSPVSSPYGGSGNNGVWNRHASKSRPKMLFMNLSWPSISSFLPVVMKVSGRPCG